jgi:hypothetical protein
LRSRQRHDENLKATGNHDTSSHNIGFISTRFAGTDGVSLETQKWATVFERLGHSVFISLANVIESSEPSLTSCLRRFIVIPKLIS